MLELLEELHKVHENEGLHLANKLIAVHMNWRMQKMKVNLAAQTISSSVAAAIEFCNIHLKLTVLRYCKISRNF